MGWQWIEAKLHFHLPICTAWPQLQPAEPLAMQGVQLHALLDTCESANLLDLPYQLVLVDGHVKLQQVHPGLTQEEAESMKVGRQGKSSTHMFAV
jgi:hypothetical protein